MRQLVEVTPDGQERPVFFWPNLLHDLRTFGVRTALYNAWYMVRFSGLVRLVAVSDTFTRADSASALGNTETGQSPIIDQGTWGIRGEGAEEETE